MKSLRPIPNPTYAICNKKGLKYLTRLRLRLSHLREHKFKHNFQDTINPLCNCSLSVESIEHYFLDCANFNDHRHVLMNSLFNIDNSFINMPNKELINLLLYGNPKFSNQINHQILSASIFYILSTNRFDENSI